jgi:hypothetical protein
MSVNTLIATLLAGAVGYDVIPAVAPDEPSPAGGTSAPPEANELLDTAADALAQLRALVVPELLDLRGEPGQNYKDPAGQLPEGP